jgi:hypothetical protein
MGSFHIRAMAISAEWCDYAVTFKTAPHYTPRRGLERAEIRIHRHDESTHNLHHQYVNSPPPCDHYAEICPGLDKNKRVCETERFPTRKKKFSDGAWCVERFHDRPFQDFVAHETKLSDPRFNNDETELTEDRVRIPT